MSDAKVEVKTVERRSTAVVSVSLPPEMVEMLDAESARRFTTRTQVVRDMILRQLSAGAEGEPHGI